MMVTDELLSCYPHFSKCEVGVKTTCVFSMKLRVGETLSLQRSSKIQDALTVRSSWSVVTTACDWGLWRYTVCWCEVYAPNWATVSPLLRENDSVCLTGQWILCCWFLSTGGVFYSETLTCLTRLSDQDIRNVDYSGLRSFLCCGHEQ